VLRNFRWLIFLMTYGLLLITATTVSADVKQLREHEERNIMIGQTYLFDYGDSAYEIKIIDDKTLNWKLVKGEYSGPHEDNDNYISSDVSSDIIFISWEEKSGLGLYNIIDLKSHKLITHAREGNQFFINTGKVTIIH